MSRSEYRGPKLPKVLLDQVQQNHAGSRNARNAGPRKARRKGERLQKKQKRAKPIAVARRAALPSVDELSAGGRDESNAPAGLPVRKQATAKSTTPRAPLVKKTLPTLTASESPEEHPSEEPDILNDGSVTSGDSFTISRHAAHAGLANEDAEIAALEKKLGVKKGRKVAETEDAELDLLLGAASSDEESDVLKRKRAEYQTWLRDKRRKTVANEVEMRQSGKEERLYSTNDPGLEDEEMESVGDNLMSEEGSEDGFEGFTSNDDQTPTLRKQTSASNHPRENPYAPPVSSKTMATYVSPSRRAPPLEDQEATKQLRRQIQGQLNRLSEANLLSIVQAIEKLSAAHSRYDVVNSLVDLLVGLISDSSALNDSFLILHAAFAAGLGRVLGPGLIAHIIAKTADAFHAFHSSFKEGKQALNLLAFVSSLYIFHAVASTLIYDYIRLLLASITESNAELLLRVIRNAGSQLRQDDPTALKEIVLLLQRNVASLGGEETLSVRTRFMIETIRNLKDNKMKQVASSASALAAELTVRLKKALGSINVRSRMTEPLRVTLADVENRGTRAQWWLPLAATTDSLSTSTIPSAKNAADAAVESSDVEFAFAHLPAYRTLNTPLRRSIFTTLLSSASYLDACTRLATLHLTNRQREEEVPRVLLHCVRAEAEAEAGAWNPYYACVARELCRQEGSMGKRMGKGFVGCLSETLRRFEEADDDDDDDDDGNNDGVEPNSKKSPRMTPERRILVAEAKFFAWLLADAAPTGPLLAAALLKRVPWSSAQRNLRLLLFLEVLLTELFRQLRSQSRRAHDAEEAFERSVKSVFEPMAAAGLDGRAAEMAARFLRTRVAKAGLARGAKDVRAVEVGCTVADIILQKAGSRIGVLRDGEEWSESDEEGGDE